MKVMDEAGCAFSLSLWERAGVRVPTGLAKPLTLTLSQRERGKKGPSHPLSAAPVPWQHLPISCITYATIPQEARESQVMTPHRAGCIGLSPVISGIYVPRSVQRQWQGANEVRDR